MSKSTQKSLKQTKQQKKSKLSPLLNSTTFAAVMEATGFASTHIVNLSTATKMCVNPPFAFLKGPTKSSLHVEKGQVMGMIYN
jgi:hypothetical protein